MRIRLVHTQSLLLIAAVLLTVLSMGALNAWNLRNGFSEFLAARDTDRLEQFATLVSQNAEDAGSMAALKAKGLGIHDLFRQFGVTQGGRLEGRPLQNAPQDLSQVLMGNSRGEAFRPPPLHPPDTANNDAFKSRVSIYATDGLPLLGKKLPSDASLYIERPIRIQGKTVATVRMVKLQPVPDDVEAHFLTSQYTSIVFAACVLLMMALLGAYWVASRWVKPLVQVQAATELIAQGAFDTRLDSTRTDEIGDTMRNINCMALSLQQLEGARRQWMADMSHELRTPLTVLRGEIDALIDGVMPLQPSAIKSLKDEVHQLNAMVDDLHLLAMSDLKALPCYFEEFDIVKLLEKMVLRFTPRAAQLGLRLKLEVINPSEKWVHWDAKRMEQLISNLIDNSLRYTDAPGKVVIRLEAKDMHVSMTVADSSPTVATRDLPLIFEPLFRADTARKRSGTGSGLGLAICNTIVQAHRGSIHAARSDLGGLLIQVALPWDAESSSI
jgi:two-component system, OmpR family, sensor histidine kinase BaeS